MRSIGKFRKTSIGGDGERLLHPDTRGAPEGTLPDPDVHRADRAMTDIKRDVQDDQGTKKLPTRQTQPRRHGRSRTAGTDRDFDESGVADNQGHGHPREEHHPQVDRPARD